MRRAFLSDPLEDRTALFTYVLISTGAGCAEIRDANIAQLRVCSVLAHVPRITRRECPFSQLVRALYPDFRSIERSGTRRPYDLGSTESHVLTHAYEIGRELDARSR